MPRKQEIHSPAKFSEGIQLVKKDGYSIRKAAKEVKIPYNTLRDHINGRFKGYDTNFGPDPLLSPEQETSLLNYCNFMASRGAPLTRTVLKKLVRDIVKQSDSTVLKIDMEKGPSDAWVKKFMNMHKDVTLRKPHAIEQCRADVTQDTLDEYFNLLKSTLKDLGLENDPSRIYNCDESGFSGSLNSSRKVIVPKGTKHAYQKQVKLSGHTTILNSISAAGQTTPPMLIYSQCLPRNCGDGVPDSWSFQRTDKGYIKNELFLEWFNTCFVPFICKRRPVLLILDNHVTHLTKDFIDAASFNKVDLLYLPAHSSHILQPQDAGYFHVLKDKFSDICVELGYVGMKTLPRHLFAKALQLAFNKVSGNTVAAAFKCTGIHPFNSSLAKALCTEQKAKTSVDVPIPEDDEAVASTSSADSDNVTKSSETCVTCGATTKENMLVKLGLVSAELANILVEPPKPEKTKKGKRKTYTKARLIRSVKSTSKKSKSKRGRKPKSRASTEIAKAAVQNTVEIAADDEQASDNGICSVCMLQSIDGYMWVGCDSCERWFHYECLPSSIQCEVDLSLVTNSRWLCNVCRAAEE